MGHNARGRRKRWIFWEHKDSYKKYLEEYKRYSHFKAFNEQGKNKSTL